MATSIRDLQDQVISLQYNPAAIQRAVLQTLSDVTSGKIEVVDASNPFVFALESAAVLTSAAMSENNTLNRQQYPLAAQDQEDLYKHMSDKDYVNRFAIPATTQFTMLLPHDELLNKLVEDPTTGIKKVVIPRNSFFTVANTVFSIQYPIEIRQLQHGGIQIVYDTSETSPLQTLTSNEIAWDLVSDGTLTYLSFTFDVLQFKIDSYTQSTNMTNLFQYTYAFTDQFCYARVYSQNSDGTWTEIYTTHSDQIYDITTPTAVLQVDGQQLKVTIPQIYTANKLVTGNVRIDVYTTKGTINMVLNNYGMDQFAIKFTSFDKNDITAYVAPLGTLTAAFVYCSFTVNGGSNGVDFATLQRQVINNSVGPQKLPISNIDLQETLMGMGYQVVTNIDNITNRTFLATRALPDPVDVDLITAAGATNATVSLSLDGISGYSYVINNGDAMTITPASLFKDTNGVVTLVSDAEISMLNSLPADQKAILLTNNGYLYTPFHYVLDTVNNGFAVRPYYLDNPSIVTKLFNSQNDKTLLQVGTSQDYAIVKTPTGYKLQIMTSSGDSFKALADNEVFCQLAYVPEGENSRAYLNGVMVDKTQAGERIYEFDLSSNMNVDAKNYLQLTKFLMFTTDARLTGASLTQDFDIVYSTTAPMDTQWEPAEVDGVLGRFLLPLNVVGITHETLRVKFGDALDTLWARSRSVISTIVFQTWEMDIPRYYAADVYQRDPVTGSTVIIVDGKPTYNILHHKGDPVLDDAGNPVYQYRKGDIKLDASGQPIPANPRGMTRQIDFMLIEGVYKFATDSSAAAYRTQMVNTLVGWLTGDLESMNKQLLEQSELFFYPKKTLGLINVMFGAGQKTSIQAGQSLQLTLYVTKAVYTNDVLKKQLQTASVTTISQQLASAQVSRSGIESALRAKYGTDVLDVELKGLGGTTNLDLFTVLDDSLRASLRKRLFAQTDDSLIVQEDLTIDWVMHELAT
jgi:hypothetical protein